MSSPLPADVREEFDRRHKDRKGRYRCADCRQKFPRAGIHIDHIRPEVDFPELKHDVDNLAPRCITDHQKKTSREATARAKARAPRPRRPWLAILTVLFVAVALPAVVLYGVPFSTVAWVYVVVFVSIALAPVARWWSSQAERPQEAPSRSGPSKDTQRIQEAVRDVVGARGEVSVRLVQAGYRIGYGGTGFEDHKEDKRFDLVNRIQSKTGQRFKPTWETSSDSVLLEKRPDLPPLVPHPGFSPDRPWQVLPVAPGVDLDLRVTSHVLIIGPTGSGKTVVIRSIVEAFADSGRRHGAACWLGDPKMVELLGFRGLSGVEKIATSDEELFNLAIDARDEMERRYSLFRDQGVPLDSHRPLLLLIDEYEEYVDRMETYWPTLDKDHPYAKRTGMKNPALGAMKSVLRMARKGHIHVVIGTQRPDASWFGGAARDNLQGRIGVGRLSADASRMCFGTTEHGRDIPASAKGRITVQSGDDAVVEAQAYFVPDRIESAASVAQPSAAVLGSS